MPQRSASRASGSINPAEGLSFSGVVVAQTYRGQSNRLFREVAPASLSSPAENSAQANGGTGGAFSAGLRDPQGVSAGLASPASEESASSSLRAEEDETAAPPTDCDTTVSELYCVAEIEEGDTLSSVASDHQLRGNPEEGVLPWELLVHSNKPDIASEDDILRPGQKIRIPYHNGTIHTVLVAETLIEIADQYGVSIDQILAIPENGISDPDNVGIGAVILIPDPARFAPLFVPDPAEEPADDEPDGSSDSGEPADSGPDIVRGGRSSASGLIWPVSGPISSYYGPRHPLGIDIDLFNDGGAPIGAAAGGVVTYAGGDPCCSYGYYVVIDHGNGYSTLYAHLSSISVGVGEVVAQGQHLGNGGTTGYSTGDHLHFEVKLNGSTVNPLNHLP